MADILFAVNNLNPMKRQPQSNRWNTRFGRFVRLYEVVKLAHALQIEPSSIYQWVRGLTSPAPTQMFLLIRLSRRSKIRLDATDIYSQRRLGIQSRLEKKGRSRRTEPKRYFPTTPASAGDGEFMVGAV